MEFFITLIYNLITIYIYIIVIYSVLTFFPNMRRTKLFQLFASVVEPLLNLFRFATVGGIGFGPLIAILLLYLIQSLIAGLY